MAGNPMGRNGMVRPGPGKGSPFAGGSFSPRRRMTPQGGPEGDGMDNGNRTGWNGAALPPGQMRQIQMGHPLNSHWAPIAQAAGLLPVAAPAGPAVAANPPMHAMPGGGMMPGAVHPGMMPGRSNGRRVISQRPMPRPLPPVSVPPVYDGGMEQFPIVY